MVAQDAAYAKGEPWLEECLKYLKANLAYFEDYIKKNMPMLKVYPLEGTYLAWVDCSALGMDDKVLHTWMLEKAKLWLDDGVMFGAEGSMYMRFNIATPTRHAQGRPRPTREGGQGTQVAEFTNLVTRFFIDFIPPHEVHSIRYNLLYPAHPLIFGRNDRPCYNHTWWGLGDTQ